MALNLSDVFQLDRVFWHRVAVFGMTAILKRTEKGIDREGKRFAAYTEKYAKLKAGEFRRKDDKRYKGKEGISLERQVTPPNFRLTGHTLTALQPIAVTSNDAAIGWRDQAATVVAGNEQRGKYRVGGITPQEHDQIAKLAGEVFARNFNKLSDVEIKVRL